MVYFLSDIHLGAGYIADPRAHERRVVAFLRHIAPTATRLYLMGDILDFWWEYRNVVPRGFTRFFGALAELADRGVEIVWFRGNHDIWIFDYLPSEIGLRVVDGPQVETILGARFFLDHGDSVGERPRNFRVLRQLFRNRLAQRMFASLHPRWTIGLAHAWSAHSRKQGGFTPPSGVGRSLVKFATDYNAAATEKIDYFIFGHQHVLERQRLESGGEAVILGDWISKFTYAVWDGSELSLRSFRAEKV